MFKAITKYLIVSVINLVVAILIMHSLIIHTIEGYYWWYILFDASLVIINAFLHIRTLVLPSK